MYQVATNLYVGNETNCFVEERTNWAVVHACKSPCHQGIIGYTGSLPSTHPNYLVYERGNHLFLNIIDPPVPLFKSELFSKCLDFIDSNIKTGNVLVHCNKGESRAPSLALLYLAKRRKTISNESYVSAANEFKKIYPYYTPGRGIVVYLSQNWQALK